MSIAFEKTLARETPAKSSLISSDGTILLIAAIALLAVICLVASAPIASDGDIGAALAVFGA
jgi:hypothetical protein